MSALAPASADQAGSMTHLVMSALEGELQRLGLDRMKVADRQTALPSLLPAWTREAPSPNGPDAPSLADQVSVEDARLCTQQPAPGADASPDLRAFSPGTANPAGVWTSPSAGPPPMSTTTSARTVPIFSRTAKPVQYAEHAPPTYGTPRLPERIAEIARERRLDLYSGAGRKMVEALFFAETGATVATATSWAEAHAAAMRDLGIRPERINCAEADHVV